MNMEKVDQSQNVLGLSWYDKNIYFFPTQFFASWKQICHKICIVPLSASTIHTKRS